MSCHDSINFKRLETKATSKWQTSLLERVAPLVEAVAFLVSSKPKETLNKLPSSEECHKAWEVVERISAAKASRVLVVSLKLLLSLVDFLVNKNHQTFSAASLQLSASSPKVP